MNTAPIHELKKELSTLDTARLSSICLRLARYKLENKELLSYLLFHEADEADFVEQAKKDMLDQLEDMNKANVYWAKKTIRKTLRSLNKYVRFSGKRQTEVELRLAFCSMLKQSGIPLRQSPVLYNLFDGQLRKIEKALQSLHEDLQYDYGLMLEELR